MSCPRFEPRHLQNKKQDNVSIFDIKHLWCVGRMITGKRQSVCETPATVQLCPPHALKWHRFQTVWWAVNEEMPVPRLKLHLYCITLTPWTCFSSKHQNMQVILQLKIPTYTSKSKLTCLGSINSLCYWLCTYNVLQNFTIQVSQGVTCRYQVNENTPLLYYELTLIIQK